MLRKLGMFCLVLLASIGLQWLGAWSNQYAMAQNGDKMPVLVFDEGIALVLAFDHRHTILTRKSKDILLCDIIPVPFPDSNYSVELDVMSVGDVLLNGGNFLMLFLPLLPILWLVRFIRSLRKPTLKDFWYQ